MENYFIQLNNINCSDKVEHKNGLSYLSWAWAWGELKKRHPDANYTIYENADGWFYHNDGDTAWVKTGVTVNGIEHIEYLPIMDYRNKSIPLGKITSFDVNKAIQRSLTKAVARHGLGLYIYAGEDLPEDAKENRDADIIDVLSKATINVEQVKALKRMIADTNSDLESFLDFYHIGEIEQLSISQFKDAYGKLKKKAEVQGEHSDE